MRILGLDIDHDGVRGTLLRASFGRIEPERYVSSPLYAPNGIDADTLRPAIADLLAACGRPPDGIVAALDGQDASLRVIRLPAGVAKRVEEVLPFELEAILPFPLDAAVVDHQPIDRSPTELRVLAAAVPRERVVERIDVLREAGADPRELAAGAAALDGLAAFLPELRGPTPHVVVVLDRASTDVCVVEGGHCVFARTITGGIDLVEGRRRDELSTALRQTLLGYRAQGGAEPTAVLLGGRAATLSGAASWLQSVLELETRVMPLPPLPGADDAERPRFARSAALAGRMAGKARRINLRRGDLAPTHLGGGLREHAKLLAICGVALLFSFFFSVWARYSILSSEHEVLMAELGEVTEELFGVRATSPQEARELLEGGRSAADPMPRFDAYDALDAISASIPEEITHTTRKLMIEIDDEARDGRFDLQGTVGSIAERDTIAARLDEHECFDEIAKGSTSPGPNNEGLTYRLEASIHCPGEGRPAQSKSAGARRSNRE